MPKQTNKLTTRALGLLRECEERIGTGLRRGVANLQDAILALITVRDEQLYAEHYEDFSSYMEQRWQPVLDECDLSDRHVRRLLAHEEIKRDTPPFEAKSGPIGPRRESHSRELARAPRDQRGEAWAEAVRRADGEPTAAEVKQVVDEMRGKSPPEQAEDPIDVESEPAEREDPMGWKIPDRCLSAFDAAESIDSELVQPLYHLLLTARRLQRDDAGPGYDHFREVARGVTVALSTMIQVLRPIGLPTKQGSGGLHVCQACDGKGCKACGKRGTLPSTLVGSDTGPTAWQVEALAKRGHEVTTEAEAGRLCTAFALAERWRPRLEPKKGKR